MNCAVHTEAAATAYCRNCGKALCPDCTRTVQGMHYCEPCLAALVTQPAAPRRNQQSPVIAFLLGFVPGLGAVYNREYTKALIHVGIFVGLVTADSTGMHQPLIGLLTAFFCMYMPVEASITATHQRDTEAHAIPAATPTVEPAAAPAQSFSPEQASGAPPAPPAPPPHWQPRLIGPVVLILLGSIFLLDNLGWLDAGRVIAHGWPLILIAMGVYMVWRRSTGAR